MDASRPRDPTLASVELTDNEVARARAIARDLRGTSSLAPISDMLEALASSLEAARRRVVRIGYDLHDGTLQEVTALGHDLHFFREQLASDVAFERRRLLVGRVDDLLARLRSIDVSLRDVATQSASHLLFDRPLAVMLVEVGDLAAGDVAVEFDIDHAFDELGLTDSQRIVMVRVVQGALTNVARHSDATRAIVTLRQDEDEVVLEVRDDGKGFELAAVLAQSAETGRLGIMAMRERARLLGGELTIDTSPGRSTTILLRLPRWRPH